MTTDIIQNLLGTDAPSATAKTFVVSASNRQNGVDVHVMSSKELKHFKGDVVEALEVDTKDAEAIAEKLRAANAEAGTPQP